MSQLRGIPDKPDEISSSSSSPGSEIPGKITSSKGLQPFAKRQEVVKVDETAVFATLEQHVGFRTTEGHDLADLPKFNDLQHYDVRPEDELRWKKQEVIRLIEVGATLKPLAFPADLLVGKATSENYNKLHNLGAQLKQILAICKHDNELILIEHCPAVANAEEYEATHQLLLREFDSDSQLLRFQRDLKIGDRNDEILHALIDYMTGTLMQILLRTMDGDMWRVNCTAILAACSAKLKSLVFDIARAAASSLDMTSEVHFRIKAKKAFNVVADLDDNGSEHDWRLPNLIPSRNTEKFTATLQREILQKHENDVSKSYFKRLSIFCSHILRLLSVVANQIESNANSNLPVNILDSSVVVYEVSELEPLTLLCQERDGSIGVTSNPHEIRVSVVPMELCRKVWNALPDSKEGDKGADWTRVAWKWTGMDGNGQLLPNRDAGGRLLKEIHLVITALIPYFMTVGTFAHVLANFSQLSQTTMDATKPIRPFSETRFLASFIVRSSGYEAERANFLHDADICNVSQHSMTQRRALAEDSMTNLYRSSKVGDKALREDVYAENQRVTEGIKNLREWVYDSNTITISYKWYCWSIMTACAFLVLGGVAIGLTVKERIKGVDPFQITGFCWLTAGFTVIIAKSMRVGNWPWRDFLTGQVVCCTLMELVGVTGMDPQLLLTLLLRLETQMVISKRGSFAFIFHNYDTSNGFLIDKPMTTSAMAEAGTILIKVLAAHGPSLVAIQTSETTTWDVIRPKGTVDRKCRPVCRNLTVRGEWKEKSGAKPRYSLDYQELDWYRILGIFETEAVFT